MVKGLIDHSLFSSEELNGTNNNIVYMDMIDTFNLVAKEDFQNIDSYGVVEFYNYCHGQIPIENWVTFLSDYRVANVMNRILLLNMKASVNKLGNSLDKSVALTQKHKQTLDFLSKHFDSIMGDDKTIFIYTAVPLTENEKNAKNAKTLIVRPSINPHNPAKGDNPNYNSSSNSSKKGLTKKNAN